VRLGEIAPLAERFVIPAGDVIDDPPPAVAKVDISKSDASSTLSFVTKAGVLAKAILRHSPLAVEIHANGQHVQTLNARNFLNFERYRKPDTHRQGWQ
jgi:hypothetical protein